jgi:ATP-dependent DNA helicase RecG
MAIIPFLHSVEYRVNSIRDYYVTMHLDSIPAVRKILAITSTAILSTRNCHKQSRATVTHYLFIDNGHFTAAMAVFGKKLFPKYAQCQLKMARFKGMDRREFLDSDLVYGNIFELFNRGEQFCKRHLPISAKIVEGNYQRVETPLLPFNAIREALLNSLCHNDYSFPSGSINLAIYDDRLELINEGKLLQGVTIEKIKRGCSKLRNKIIAGVLYKCKYIEAWGRGIKSIIEACREANVPPPEFDVDDIEFKIIFKFPHNITPEIVTPDKGLKFTPRQKEILEILSSAGTLPLKDIAAKLSQKIDERKLRYELSKLRKVELINFKGTTKGAVWFVNK